MSGSEYHQVREKKGGGTRHFKAKKGLTVEAMERDAVKLFFPNGISKHFGCLSEYRVSMRDIADTVLLPSTTLEQIFVRLKTKMVRIYFCTDRVFEPSTQNAQMDESVHDELVTNTENDVGKTSGASTQSVQSDASASVEITLGEGNRAAMEIETITHADMNASKTTKLENQPTSQQTDRGASTSLVLMPVNEADHGRGSHVDTVDDYNYDLNAAIARSLDDSGIVQIGNLLDLDISELQQLDDTVPLDVMKVSKIRLHRGQVFKELNETIKKSVIDVTDQIEVEMIAPNGKLEAAEDSGGVFRDALSEYWETFYKKCTGQTGCIRVPLIRHDMTDIWEATAKVLVLGHNMVGYFPVALSKPFLEYCLGKEPTEQDLVNCFLNMVPLHEKESIQEQSFTSEDFIDMLEAHEVKTLVTENNWKKILQEVAHKEIIQQPAFVADCWAPVLKKYLKLPIGGIDELLASLYPTPKKIIASLDFGEDLKQHERAIESYLKRFIRNSTPGRLQKFLRFCTGADVLVCPKVYVRFVEPISDFTRTPVGHTCGCVLELPKNYSSAADFAEEMDELLVSNIWVMDIL